MIGAEQLEARSVDRPAVRVHCVGTAVSDRDMGALCRQMVQSLANVQPRATFRQVTAAEWRPRGPGDLSVRLEVADDAGHLSWQVGSMGELQTGPGRRLRVSEAVNTAALRRFTDDLVAATPRMVSALAAVTSR